MTVRANKPAFNIREKLKELTSKFGLKGTELARAETVQDARDLVSAGRKNMVINGDMRIFQRNNAGNSANSNSYFLDRWMTRENSEGVLYVTQQSSSSGGPSGFRSWLLAQCDGADTTVDSGNYVRIQQYIEGYNCFMDWGYGNTDYVTASFWVKSNKTGIYCFQIEDGDALPLYCQEYVIEQADVWQKVVLTIPPPPTGTWRGADSGIGARLTWTLMAGSGHPTTANVWQSGYGMRTDNQVNFMDNANNNFYLTGVQLEVGKNATDFEYRSYAEELALCQRYFQRIGGEGRGGSADYNNYIASGFIDANGSEFYGGANLKVSMRTSPTITFDGTISTLGYTQPGLGIAANNLTSYWSCPQSYVIRISSTASGGTTGFGAYARVQNDNSQLNFSAEL